MTTYHELLREHFIEKRRKNPSFSMRAFARQLGLTPGGLSRLLNGKLDLSVERSMEICAKLALDEKETENFLNLVQFKKAKSTAVKEKILRKIERANGAPMFDLSVDHFKMISEWYPMAVLKIAGEPKMNRSPQAIAKKLGITTSEVNQAAERLKRLELIEEVKGELHRVPEQEVLAEFKVDNDAVKKYYLELLAKAQENIEKEKAITRSVAAKVLIFDDDQIEAVRKITDEYHQKLGELSSKSKKKEKVYQSFASVFEIKGK